MTKNITIGILAILVIGLAVFGFIQRKQLVVLQSELEEINFANNTVHYFGDSEDTTNVNSDKLSEYKNSELHFSFSYPASLGNGKTSYDVNPQRIGEQFNGSFLNNNSDRGIYFGASSSNYDPKVGRGIGLSDMFRDMNITSTEVMTVSDIEVKGVKGKLIVGTEACTDLCPFAQMTAAVFPLPTNDKGIKVIGISSYGMSKDEFRNLISTFNISN